MSKSFGDFTCLCKWLYAVHTLDSGLAEYGICGWFIIFTASKALSYGLLTFSTVIKKSSLSDSQTLCMTFCLLP